MFDTQICPVCKKHFVKAVSSIYYVKIHDKKVHVCSYTCYQKAKQDPSTVSILSSTS